MASTFSTDLKLELMATGENAGTWGTKTNTNLNLVQQAIAGFESISVTTTTIGLTMDDGSISQARNMVLAFGGSLTGATNVTVPNSIEKMYILDDRTTHNTSTITFKTVSGTGFAMSEGKKHIAYSDGTNMNRIDLSSLGGEIATASIADNAITTAKISDNQIVTAKISDNQITTVKISDNQITTAKIVNNAVDSDKLARKFTITTNVTPAGGSDGDLWFVYA
tara:strand:- start:37 stop:705 length:669 start_codon:yes stop_codon:yes gene_type:complete